MPKVIVARRLKIFLEDSLDGLFPRDRWVRVVAHPTRLPEQIAPSAGGGEENAAATGSEARVNEGTKDGEMDGDGIETKPVPGLRFSQVEPPTGDASLV